MTGSRVANGRTLTPRSAANMDETAAADAPATFLRYNCNLRGHHNPIQFVSWNREQRKLASCDDTGIIYVWVPYEDRWSVELVNDRGVKVRDFCWSPSGQSALICYEDNFVLIGSANGQRIWSNHYPNDQQMVSGAWSPDSRHVILGSKTGVLNVLSDQGAQFTEHTVLADKAIEKATWSPARQLNDKSTICLYLGDGLMYFMRSFDDPDPTIVDTKIHVVTMEWSMDGEYLAVCGWRRATDTASARDETVTAVVDDERTPAAAAATTTTLVVTEEDRKRNLLMVFNSAGVQLLNVIVPFSEETCPPSAVTAMAWCDDGVAVAAGGEVRVGRVVTHGVVPPLAHLASHRVWRALTPPPSDRLLHDAVRQLPLPNREIASVLQHNHHMVKCRIPTYEELARVSCQPTQWRWYCTIRPSNKKAQSFQLCMEHLGGMVPVLTGRQTNRLLPEFEIHMPRRRACGGGVRRRDDLDITTSTPASASSPSRSRSRTPDVDETNATGVPATSDTASSTPKGTPGDGAAVASSGGGDVKAATPSLQRNTVWRRSKKQLRAFVHKAQQQYGAERASSATKRVSRRCAAWETRKR